MNHREVIQKAKKYITLLKLVFILVFITQRMLYATGGIPAGSGTIADPFLIADYADLKVVGTSTAYPGSAVYRLVADIDAAASQSENAGAGFVPINDSTINYFTGTFHGAVHVIRNLHISGPVGNNAALFANLWGGTIDSLGVLNAHVTADGGYVGILVSDNNTGTITNCYVTGSAINTNGSAGGLVCGSTGTISNCFSTANVSGTDYVGGLMATNSDIASNCYTTGTVSGRNYVGGIAGDNTSTLTDCYAIGSVSGSGLYIAGIAGGNHIATDCYWDTLTTGCASGCAFSSGSFSGAGLSTAEMKQSSSYSGWDFTTIWSINPSINGGYPYLTSNIITSVQAAAIGTPKSFLLLQNYPNPFNPTTTIRFSVEKDGRAAVKVFDILGREMAILFYNVAKAGQYYTSTFNGSKFSSGVYFYTIESNNQHLVKKMMILK
ncbi:MAG: T9SS type A sorting domain-containing protein [Bacteroidota bacterium]